MQVQLNKTEKEDEAMFKKVLIILSCVGCMCLFVNKAEAGWPVLSGWNVDWGSVDCISLWKSFGNTLKDGVVTPEVGCTIYPVVVETQCKNPAGNTGGGVVFELMDREFGGYDFVSEEDLSAKGQYDSFVGFSDSEIYTAFGGGTTNDICDEFNGSGNENSLWELVPPPEGYFDVIKMFVAFRAYVDQDDDGFLDDTPVEDVHVACKAPEGADFSSEGNYYCTELCDKTKRTDCIENPYDYLTQDLDGDGEPDFTFFD
jgi:hypothetical protein